MITVSPRFGSHFQVRMKAPVSLQEADSTSARSRKSPLNPAADYHQQLAARIIDAVARKTDGRVLEISDELPRERSTWGCHAYVGETRTEIVVMDEHDDLVEREIKGFLQDMRATSQPGTFFSYEKLADSSLPTMLDYDARRAIAHKLAKAEGPIREMAKTLKQLGLPVEKALALLLEALN